MWKMVQLECENVEEGDTFGNKLLTVVRYPSMLSEEIIFWKEKCQRNPYIGAISNSFGQKWWWSVWGCMLC